MPKYLWYCAYFYSGSGKYLTSVSYSEIIRYYCLYPKLFFETIDEANNLAFFNFFSLAQRNVKGVECSWQINRKNIERV